MSDLPDTTTTTTTTADVLAERVEQTIEHLPIGSVADILEAAKHDGTEEILDIAEWGMSVRIKSLTAADDARMKSASAVPGQNGSAPRVDIGAMERVQFQTGVVEPKFRMEDVNVLQHRSSSGFKRVIRALDRISGGSEADQIAKAEETFPG